MVERANKYAYHFFFRRMMPLTFMKRTIRPSSSRWRSSRSTTSRRQERTLDLICDGILDYKPFIYPAEELGVHDL